MKASASPPDSSQPREAGLGKESRDTIHRILPLLGANARLLHPMAGYGGGPGGGDFDCAVDRLDPQWPLRAEGVRVCQCIRHGPTGWYWVVEDAGAALAVDALDDPMGIGPICFPTGLAFAQGERSFGAVRAAFVTLKRLRKGIRRNGKWATSIEMAATDPKTYASCLEVSLGKRLGGVVSRSVLAGRIPPPDAWKRAAIAMRMRRLRSPKRATVLLARSLARLTQRILHSTGFIVAIVGPDGAGKSALASALLPRCQGYFWRSQQIHWRPGVLPRVGALVGSRGSDPERPHNSTPHGRLVSIASLLYYWLDFFLGFWLKLMPLRTRSAVIVLERGWWDIVVDPRRYRMHVPRSVVIALGRLLPRPDMTLILEAPGSLLLQRKEELTMAEAERQTRLWRDIARKHLPHTVLDATLPPAEVEANAVELIISSLEKRMAARTGPGWFAISDRGSVRWVIPRGPRNATRNGLRVYQPVTIKGWLGWQAGRAAAGLGIFRILPRGKAPNAEVRGALARHLPPRGTMAVLKANHRGRFVALIMGEDGEPSAVAKVASDDAGRAALDWEAHALETLGPLLAPPLRAPRILDHDNRVLLLEAVSWRPRPQPWNLPAEVAHALGAFFAAGRSGNGRGPAHGDFAPWNLLETEQGWVVVDWERSRSEAPPFYDLFHYLVQSCALLRRPSQDAIIQGLTREEGTIAALVRAYAEGASLATDRLGIYFLEYIYISRSEIDPAKPKGLLSLRVRDQLQGRIRQEP